VTVVKNSYLSVSCQEISSVVKIYLTMNHKDYEHCTLCPRNCSVNRLKGRTGFCGESADLRIAWAGIHYGEEPVITGKNGSGTIFFTGCTLQCVFCQNYQLSGSRIGSIVTACELSDIMLGLEKMNAENINLVTGTHFIPHIVDAVGMARKNGLGIPIVWNTSGFEKEESLILLKNTVDIFLTDLKSLSVKASLKLFKTALYPEIAVEAVAGMIGAKPLKMHDKRLAGGVIVRHLVIPGALESTYEILKLFKNRWYKRAVLSLMFQFIPVDAHRGIKGAGTGIPGMLSADEYSTVTDYLFKLEIDDGFMQEFSESDEWMPDFKRHNPFPGDMAKPLWHFTGGYNGG